MTFSGIGYTCPRISYTTSTHFLILVVVIIIVLSFYSLWFTMDACHLGDDEVGIFKELNIQVFNTKKDSLDFIESIDTFLLDCDGVIWIEQCLLPDIQATITWLRSLGKRLFFITNNSTKSRQEYVEKFGKLGIQVYQVSNGIIGEEKRESEGGR
jgi:hypothetical protein